MPRIYREAASVLVWLGEEVGGTGRAIDGMSKWLKEVRNNTTKRGFIASYSDIEDHLPTDDVCDLLTRPWYGRVWTLQEAILARRITFLVGGHALDWDFLERFVKEIQRNDPFQRSRLAETLRALQVNGSNVCNAMSAVPNIRVCKSTYDFKFFPHLLRMCRGRDCFDPKDRVYGILGILTKDLQRDFTADPSENDTVTDVYIPFAILMLQSDVSFQALSMVESTVRDPTLPSWCPDFHQRSEAKMLADYDSFRHGYKAGFGRFTTTVDLSWRSENRTELTLTAATVDDVQSIVDGQWADPLSPANEEIGTMLIKDNSRWLAACIEAVNEATFTVSQVDTTGSTNVI
jgi:Heterokaryon incompatibility protein (HET)